MSNYERVILAFQSHLYGKSESYCFWFAFFSSHTWHKENPLWKEFAVVVMDKKVLFYFGKNEVSFTKQGKNSGHEP